jgi:anti-sigma factor RsiW
MTCAEFEILLADYVDNALHGAAKSAVEQHAAACPACAALVQDVTSAVQFMERTATVDAPAELLTRILHEAPTTRMPWRRRILGRWLDSILQPRYVMGMAMTLVSFSMVARFASPRQLRPSDLDPAKVWSSVDDRVHRSWDRAVKYYENLRWVLEIQSRVKEFQDQEQEAQKDSAAHTKNAGQEAGAEKGKP